MTGRAVHCIVIRGAPALAGLLIKKTNVLIEKMDLRMRWPPVTSFMRFWIVPVERMRPVLLTVKTNAGVATALL